MTSSSNKRIAKNTIFLYLRMLFVMAVSFYTSRVILAALGVTDYGVFNVVGGLSSTFVFFSSALSNATQRFLNFGHGEKHERDLGNIFNLSLELYSAIALIVIIIGIAVGNWVVTDVLVIPNHSIPDAKIVLYTTLAVFAITLVTSVYESVLIARENMKIYAYLGIFDVLAKLGIAYAVTIIDSNRLAWYAVLLATVGLIPKLSMVVYCRVKYIETKIRLYWDTVLFKKIFSFAGWNIYGTGVWMINQQGINILLNLFFGPVINAARGIAMQVTAAINNFVVNFYTAVRPQIIKRYAAGEMDSYLNLIYTSSKFSVFLLWTLCLPVFFRINYVLSIWLVDVPDFTASFVIWVLAFSFLDTLNNPLWSAIQAVGNLKKTLLYGSSWFLMAFPLSWIALKMGAPAWSVYPVLIFVRATYLVIVFRILTGFVPIKGSDYLKKIIFPCMVVMCISFILAWVINGFCQENLLGLCAMTLMCVAISLTSIIAFGLNKNEKEILIIKYHAFIKKYKR